MSYAVVRGKPYAAQLYLDQVLDGIIEKEESNNIRSRESILLSELLFHCLKERPHDLFMINATTGEKFTNQQILKRAISIARALTEKGATGKVVVFLVRNHEYMTALYFATIFAGVVPLLLEPSSTAHEMKVFLKMVLPYIIFCDNDIEVEVTEALFENSSDAAIIVADEHHSIIQFIGDSSDDIDTFQLADATPESAVLMLPTSGSAGKPKAVVLNHQGLVVQIPTLWVHFNKFPTPTNLAFLVSTPQWMTHSIIITTCTIYRIPILMTPTKTNPEHILEVMNKYKPSWMLTLPCVGSAMAATANDELKCLKILMLTGGPLTIEIINKIKPKLTSTTYVTNGYGMTEMQSFVSVPEQKYTLLGSTGQVFNTMAYKIVDDDGNALGLHKTGELYLKSKYCTFKAYYNNDQASKEVFTFDGWFKTGDLFYEAEEEQLFFVSSKKFVIEICDRQISPEEVERVINGVPGVVDSVVCGTSKGVAAAVILKPGSHVSKDDIHRAVSVLNKFMRLQGGVAYVNTFPRTHSGKILRNACIDMVYELIDNGICL